MHIKLANSKHISFYRIALGPLAQVAQSRCNICFLTGQNIPRCGFRSQCPPHTHTDTRITIMFSINSPPFPKIVPTLLQQQQPKGRGIRTVQFQRVTGGWGGGWGMMCMEAGAHSLDSTGLAGQSTDLRWEPELPPSPSLTSSSSALPPDGSTAFQNISIRGGAKSSNIWPGRGHVL